MDEKILKKIVENKRMLVPFIFTEKQVLLVEKHLKGQKMSNSEKTYFYAVIKKKIDALTIFENETYGNGEGIIEDRAKKAEEILKGFAGKKAFISGSFLYAKKYNDIDIYIVGNRRKETHDKNKHFIFITEKDLEKPIIHSAAKSSISNFRMDLKKPIIQKPGLSPLIMAYELAINDVFNADDSKAARDLIFEYRVHVRKSIPYSYEVATELSALNSFGKEKRIREMNRMMHDLLDVLYSKKYLYNETVSFLKQLKDLMKNEKYENLVIFADFFEEVKDECRRSKGEA